MTTSTRLLYDSHPSVTASMEDFESRDMSPDLLNVTSNSRLQFRSPVTSVYSDMSEDIHRGWSPPPWRKHGTGWYQHQSGLKSPPRSRETSPLPEEDECIVDEDDDDEDVSMTAARIALPESPLKGRTPERDYSPAIKSIPTKTDYLTPPLSQETRHDSEPPRWQNTENNNNYIRFSVRADVQHRTEPIEAAVTYVRKTYSNMTKSKYSTFLTFVGALLAITIARALFREPAQQPQPDLVRVAGLAKSFEPLMYYSENGHTQVVQLGETGVAVWDLGESVRSTNMTSGPIIVRELDELSESLKSLAQELTRFFASVDGDVDSILIVMEWAQRELNKLSAANGHSASHLSLAFSNLHTLLSRLGIFEKASTGEPTALGALVTDLFGRTKAQTTRATLHRTFNEFLSVLEEGINNELTASISLFAHFEAIDRQFLNLQRTVIRETDAQEREESELLASLWARVIGPNSSRLRKFDRNKALLSSLRERTITNKHVLVDHNGRLLQLRSNLEILRKKLVSPLVRANDSSTLTVEEQIEGLRGTYEGLRGAREAQKSRLMGAIHEAAIANFPKRIVSEREAYGSGAASSTVGDGYAIDGRRG
ncbi:hypothetical protein AAFC00_004961 [Neodothiora populina]|uniref:Uncharacterized protein n=1 Tax=Neodothiora populina TaxID=2781224 RepID=A0ABR3P424_9PEZI